MAQNQQAEIKITAHYDEQSDILTYAFVDKPQPAVAEEAADEIWVRFDPDSRRVITVDVHHFSQRVEETFGPSLTYNERTDPERIEALLSIPFTN